MSGVGDFLLAITPALLELGRELFKSTKGDPAKARKNIRSLTATLRKARAEVDAAARRKFGR